MSTYPTGKSNRVYTFLIGEAANSERVGL